MCPDINLHQVGFTERTSRLPLVSSYLAFPSLRAQAPRFLLLHFPWSRLHWELPSTLPYGAPDLPRPSRGRGHSARSSCLSPDKS